jgi:pyruvate dehydrogenase E2 component (dihydrolipoamide acetyltransferase)
MAQKVVMPKLAMGMSTGTVTSWKFAEGQFVEKGQILLVIETEKVSYEIEALKSGYLHIVIPEGETVPVMTIIAYLAANEEELAGMAGTSGGSAPAPESKTAAAAEPPPQIQEEAAPASQGDRVIASPLAKKLAKINDIDLKQVSGTGPHGRIVKDDVMAAVETRKAAPAAEAAPVAAPPAEAPALEGRPRVKAVVPVRGMRKAIADSMMKSLREAAQLSFTIEVDATELVRLRQSLVAKEKKLGIRVSYTDILALVFVRAIKNVPIVNASLIGEEILVWDEINLGIAIATEINEYECGLLVPVVKNAGCKSLLEISREIKELTGKAREGTLSLEDMQGGTVTLSSAAFVKLSGSSPILNPGQALLIQPGPITDKPVAKDGEVVVRPILTISFTFDHRIADGIPLGKFAKYVTDFLEDPELLL